MIPTWNHSPRSSVLKTWPTLTALAVLWMLTFAGQYWVYALLFLAWGVYDLATGESSFIQRVSRRDQPLTYWLVVSTWILLSALWLAYPDSG